MKQLRNLRSAYAVSACRKILPLVTAASVAITGCGGTESVTTPEPAESAGTFTSSPAQVSTITPSQMPIEPNPTPTLRSALLQWDAVSVSDLAGYRVYYGTSPGAYAQPRGQGVDAGRVISFAVNNLQRGVTYYFTVTSYDFAGNESAYSPQVSKRVE